jgi:signal transduction histidine kinase
MEAPPPLLARLPAAPVRQIVLNLLLNAGAAAGRTGEVGLEVTAAPDALTVAIEDDGPGLGPADLDRLMASGPLPPGGGVGLRLVRDLVAGLGGAIRHDRHEGRTRIRVDLPLGGAADA